MRTLKKFTLLQTLYKWILMYPTPVVLTYLWNFGSLAGLALVIQTITGVALAMWYGASVDVAFASVEFIMREVYWGWLICDLHANGTLFFFIVLSFGLGSMVKVRNNEKRYNTW